MAVINHNQPLHLRFHIDPAACGRDGDVGNGSIQAKAAWCARVIRRLGARTFQEELERRKAIKRGDEAARSKIVFPFSQDAQASHIGGAAAGPQPSAPLPSAQPPRAAPPSAPPP